jgi:hypothetical protein
MGEIQHGKNKRGLRRTCRYPGPKGPGLHGMEIGSKPSQILCPKWNMPERGRLVSAAFSREKGKLLGRHMSGTDAPKLGSLARTAKSPKAI